MDEQGRLHTAAVTAQPDPPSLVDLRTRLGAMLPRVDLPELILEVISWQPRFLAAFTAASGGTTRLADLDVSLAAALCKHALNVDLLSRGGNLTQLGEVIAHYGRIFKTLHVLSFVEHEPYRREVKGMRNLQESRHSLARRICHGNNGELRHGYQTGMEDQLGALGLVLNCVTLWNTVYLDAAVAELRAQGYPVLEADLARLSAYLRDHINVDGHYTFHLPELEGTRRPLRDPDAMGEL